MVEEERRQWVVLVPCSFQGHITPMLELGIVLRSRGFSIAVAHSNLNSPNPSNRPDFIFLPLCDGFSGADSVDSSRNLFDLILELNVKCKAPLEECVAGVMERWGPHDQVACIVYDTLMYCGGHVAENLKLPSIALRTSNASSCFTIFSLPRLQQQGFFPLKDDSRLKELVPELYPLRYKDLPFSKILSLEALVQLTDMLCRTSSSALIWNTMDCLEHQTLEKLRHHLHVPIFPIGPLHKFAKAFSTSLLEEDSSCISWLDKQPPHSVLYVSLGSLVTIDEKALAEMAWGLARTGQPFLWVLRPGTVPGSRWTELLPENFEEVIGERGHIVKWAPQKKVLAHTAVGGFWSHCGWNSTLESLSQGVPMICWPGVGDQNVTARHVSHEWGVGLEMERELDREEIERAVRRLMVEEEGMEIRKRAMRFKEEVELAIMEGGCSHNSLDELVKFILSL